MERIKNYIYSQVAAQKLPAEEAMLLLKEIFEAKPNQNLSNEVAIIGLGCRMPGAGNKEEFWRLLEQGVSCIGNFPPSRRADTDQFFPGITPELEEFYKKGGYLKRIDEFDAAFFRIPPKEAELMDPAQRIFLETAWEAIEDAGFGGEKIYGSQTGVFVGKETSVSSEYGKLMIEDNPLAATGVNTSILASRLAYIFNLKGPCPVIDTACSSSMVALHMAYRAVVDQEVDLALAGGVSISFLPLAGIDMIESQEGKLCSFDKRADGTVWGEGFIVAALKPLERALRDRDHIYAVIKGSAINNDGASNGLTAPSAEAQAEVIGQALKRAKVNPETITYIEAHGTGTKLGDPIEIQGIHSAYHQFTTKKQFCGIGTVKTNIGHLVGASGMAGLLKMALALQHKKLPASLNFSEPNPFINFIDSPLYVNDRLRDWDCEGFPRRCGINSFGFSGTNGHLILEEAPVNETEATAPERDLGELCVPRVPCGTHAPWGTQIFTLSAKTEDSFRRLVQRYCGFLTGNIRLNLGDLCYTANTGRGHYNYRLALLADGLPDLIGKLTPIASLPLQEMDQPGAGIFMGKHFIIVNQKQRVADQKQKTPDEIFEAEKLQLSERANQFIEEMLRQSSDDQGLEEICRFYIQGADIAWDKLYFGAEFKTLSLPTYPFDHKRYWCETGLDQLREGLRFHEEPQETDMDFYYQTVWIPEPLSPGGSFTTTGALIINDHRGLGAEIVKRLKQEINQVVVVDFGPVFQKVDRDHYHITGSQADYEQIFNELKERPLSTIFHLATITGESEFRNLTQVDGHQKRGVWSLYYLIRALFKNKLKSINEVILISETVHEVTGAESRIIPENAPLFGLGKVIGMEYTGLQCRALDVDEFTTAAEILGELAAPEHTFVTAYRNGERFVEVLKQVPATAFESQKITIKEQGIYIITGGAGGIGLEMGKYLASRNRINLALINRSRLPDRSEWEAIIARDSNTKLAKKLQEIRAIEENGSRVHCYSADVSNPEEIARIITEIRRDYGKINGIIHSAGVAGDGFIIRKEDEVFQKVLAPKIQGTWILDRLTQTDQLDFFVMFSSIASVLAGSGQGDYTAANSYLDSFTAYRNRQGKKTLTINWPSWKEIGMAVDYGATQDSVFKALGTARALECFSKTLHSNLTHIIIGALNYRDPSLPKMAARPELFRLSDDIKQTLTNRQNAGNQRTKAQPKKLYEVQVLGKTDRDYTATEMVLARIWAEGLGVKEINIYDDFYELGGDSILAIQIINNINETLSQKSNISDLFEYGNIAAFAGFLDAGRGDQAATKTETSSPPAPETGETAPTSPLTTETGEYDLSDLQQSIWLIQKSYPEMTGYNLPLRFTLPSLDLQKWQRSLDLMVKRHPVLRTVFREQNGIPKQIILENLSLALEVVDLSQEDRNEELFEALLQKRNRQVYDLAKPLSKAEIFILGPGKYYFYLKLHHIMLDGWSALTFHDELLEFYNAYCNELVPDPAPLKLRYVDWVQRRQKWLESEAAREVESYWLQELSKPLPVLSLPLDFKRKAGQTFQGDNLRLKLGAADSEALKALAHDWNVTLHTLFCAAYFILLYKITTDPDLIVGVPLAGRDERELEKVMGLFINMVCIRVNFNQINTIGELMKQVRDKSLQAYKYGSYPFNLLVQKINPERDPSRNPIFSTIFQFFKVTPTNEDVVQVDINVYCIESESQLEVLLLYNKDLFRQETVERMLADYQTIIKTIIKNQDMAIAQIELGRKYQKEAQVLQEEIEFRF